MEKCLTSEVKQLGQDFNLLIFAQVNLHVNQIKMKEVWNQRYASQEYIYGRSPNVFFKQEIDKLSPGKILLPMEGEGRNAVYAAQMGWEVVAYDFSEEGRKKAMLLAKECGVEIQFLISDNDSFASDDNDFDALALVFTHLPSGIRQRIFRSLLNYLKPGAEVILELYSKEQLALGTGGPPNIDFLVSKADLEADFECLNPLIVIQKEVTIEEGIGHSGRSSVIQLRGVK
jgi:hypothetical protein